MARAGKPPAAPGGDTTRLPLAAALLLAGWLCLAATALPAGEVVIDPDWRGQTIYHLLLARFADGDPGNDFYDRERVASGDPHWRGDCAGAIAHLDHIVDLGFTAICLSPPFAARGGQGWEGTTPYDWTRVDPRLESPGATLRDLITAAKSRGLKVMLEVVVNHSCNYGIREKTWVDRLPEKYFRDQTVAIPWPYVFNLGNYRHPFRCDNDNRLAPGWFQDRTVRDPWGGEALLDKKTGTLVPREGYRADRFFDTDEADLDPAWYHREGWLGKVTAPTATEVQRLHLASNALDLATENQTVQDYLAESLRPYLGWGVDALRIRDARHVERRDLHRLLDRWNAMTPQGVFVVADVAARSADDAWGRLLPGATAPSALAPWWYSRTGPEPADPDSGPPARLAVVDHGLRAAFAGSVTLGRLDGIAAVLARDVAYGDPTRLVTVFQGPDLGPDAVATARFAGPASAAALAYNLMWTLRGIPCLFYGEECEFQKGAPFNCGPGAPTLASSGKAYYGDRLAASGSAAPAAHPLYRHLQRLNAIRRRIPALQRGIVRLGQEWGDGAGLSFVRDLDHGRDVAAVGVAGAVPQEITFTRLPPGTYSEAITGASAWIGSGSPSLTCTVKDWSLAVWVRDGPGKIGSDGAWLR